MANFVQIRKVAFNPDWIVAMYFGTNTVGIHLAAQDNNRDQIVLTFKAEEYHDFMSWWENKADVYVAG